MINMENISREQAVARAFSLQVSPQRFLLGIIGKPGAGKSTFTQFLLEQLSNEFVAILPMDGFHLSNEDLNALGRRERKGAPDTFDVANFVKTLHEVKTGIGTDIYFPLFDRAQEASIPRAGLIPAQAQLVIVEGNYLLNAQEGWAEVRDYLDESWFLNIDDQLRIQRLIARHISFGKSPEDAKAWSEGTDEANARLIQNSAKNANYEVRLD